MSYEAYYCDICGEEHGGSSHYHCSNCGKESGLYGCAMVRVDLATGETTMTFPCTRPAWWQTYLDLEAEEVAARERARMNEVGEAEKASE